MVSDCNIIGFYHFVVICKKFIKENNMGNINDETIMISWLLALVLVLVGALAIYGN